MAEHDLSKLPKWAQQEISRLRANEKHLRRRIEAGPEDSNVFAEPYSDSPTPLGKDTTIEFRFGDGWHQKFKVDLVGEYLEIYGGNTLQVEPQASNVVRIRPKQS
jgi:hypothetical protein